MTSRHGHHKTGTVAGGRPPSRRGRSPVGVRHLFPRCEESLGLLERARLWAARHHHGYFVGWSPQRLLEVAPELRPLQPITEEMYRAHMNRSEFCRNVKLKFCLDSKAEWAKEFRRRLRVSPQYGGFTGLCQAKIVAAELWREHSKEYKRHQARFPNKGRRSGSKAASEPNDKVEGLETRLSSNVKRLEKEAEDVLSTVKTHPQYYDLTSRYLTNRHYAPIHLFGGYSVYTEATEFSGLQHGDVTPYSHCAGAALSKGSRHQVLCHDRALTLSDLEQRTALVERLWDCRAEIRRQLQLSPALSWPARLQPHAALLTSQLGGDYTPSPDAQDCLIDFSLAVVHSMLF